MKTQLLSVAIILSATAFTAEARIVAPVPPTYNNNFVVDNFAVSQAAVKDTTADGIATVSTIPGVRTITHNLLATQLPTNSQTEVVPGLLDIANGVDEFAAVTLSWNLGANSLLNATNAAYHLDILATDGNPGSPIDIHFLMNGQTLGSYSVPGGLFRSTSVFAMGLSNIAAINAGGLFQMRVDSAFDAWDFAASKVSIDFAAPVAPLAPVNAPEPSAYSLFGLAMLGFIGHRYSRKSIIA